ncbi:MAG: sulfotransferase domain-containing protein [Litorilinea sp.]
MTRLPNFLIIGKAKSGTSALYTAMRSHPQVFMPALKEPGFFGYEMDSFAFLGMEALRMNRIDNLDAYRRLFANVTTETAIGEASTLYLFPEYAAVAAESIHRHVPEMRLIAILRHPAEYVHSIYHFWRMFDGMESAPTLEGALALEAERRQAGIDSGLWYLEGARNYTQLRAYYDRFPRAQIKVLLYEDWRNQPAQTLATLLSFIGVDPEAARIEPTPVNVTRVQRIPWVRKLIGMPHPLLDLARKFVPAPLRKAVALRLQAWNRNGSPPPLSAATRRMIVDATREDILKTQELIGRDLSHWLR